MNTRVDVEDSKCLYRRSRTNFFEVDCTRASTNLNYRAQAKSESNDSLMLIFFFDMSCALFLCGFDLNSKC